MTAAIWIGAGAFFGSGGWTALLLIGGAGLRTRLGLGAGKTVALDNVLLTSRRLRLSGTPDRLIRSGNMIIPEEWKSAKMVRDWRRAQMGVYFLLIGDRLGVRQTHGFLVSGDGSRHQIDNSEGLRAWVLEIAAKIRATRAQITGTRSSIGYSASSPRTGEGAR